jgi:hypothetical protein
LVMRLMQGDFAGADPARGRFRDLLKTAIRNMVRDRWNRQKRRRTVDYAVDDVAAEREDDDCWIGQWRESVLDLAWKALEQDEQAQAGGGAYTLLRLRADFPDDSSEQLAARFSQRVGQSFRADAVRQKLRRARLQFADLLISEIAKGLKNPSPEKIEDELVALGLIDLVRALLPDDWKSKAHPT